MMPKEIAQQDRPYRAATVPGSQWNPNPTRRCEINQFQRLPNRGRVDMTDGLSSSYNEAYASGGYRNGFSPAFR
jgi:hypothetical protein